LPINRGASPWLRNFTTSGALEAALGARTIHEDEPKVLDVGRRVVDAFPSPFFILTWTFFIQ
jgi:hypothetical protein